MYRDRRCEGCGSLFVATPKDVRERVFACKSCRDKKPEPIREGIVYRHGFALLGDGHVTSHRNYGKH